MQKQQSNVSKEFVCSLLIGSATEGLRIKMLPYICTENGTIDWEAILNEDFSDADLVGVRWAYTLCHETAAIQDPFALNDKMTLPIAKAIISSLVIYWEILPLNTP